MISSSSMIMISTWSGITKTNNDADSNNHASTMMNNFKQYNKMMHNVNIGDDNDDDDDDNNDMNNDNIRNYHYYSHTNTKKDLLNTSRRKTTILKSLNINNIVTNIMKLYGNDNNSNEDQIKFNNPYPIDYGIEFSIDEHGDLILEYDIKKYFNYDHGNDDILIVDYKCCCKTDYIDFCGMDNNYLMDFEYKFSYVVINDTHDWKLIIYINNVMTKSHKLECYYITTIYPLKVIHKTHLSSLSSNNKNDVLHDDINTINSKNKNDPSIQSSSSSTSSYKEQKQHQQQKYSDSFKKRLQKLKNE